jgi:ribose transport system substrate-binding protein
MSVDSAPGNRYLVGAFLQAYQVMAAFGPNEILRLRDVVERTGLAKGTAFRLLYTLHETGFLEKTDPSKYRLRINLPGKTKYRLGLDVNVQDEFTSLVSESLTQAAANLGVELLILDNRDGQRSLQNADSLIRERVDLATIFQGDGSISEALAAKYARAGIPIIAIDVPHPGAYFFGANNYHAGVLAGRHLGKWATRNWSDTPSDIILIEYRRAGPIPQARVDGMLAGFRDTFRSHEKCPLFRLDSIGDYASAYEATCDHFRHRASQKAVVAAVNGPAALAVVQALKETGLNDSCAVVSQSAEPSQRVEMRRPGSPLIGSVAYFPEEYGAKIVRLARQILGGPPPPRVTFTRHVLVTAENVNRIYPNDDLVSFANRQLPLTKSDH